MEFPLWFLLIPYLAILVLAGILLFFNIFHLNRYGVARGGTRGVMIAYAAGFLAIVLVTGISLLEVDWLARIELGDLVPFSLDANDFGL